ncbi:unnamed protein product [Acanthoscelides obtectus]|nr:unnamed protein product [Acanthoscelides obtectus]CAK1671509.1 hypothetical protein AOBTE_LOCUS28284 [Acanthoscelides obtectus]
MEIPNLQMENNPTIRTTKTTQPQPPTTNDNYLSTRNRKEQNVRLKISVGLHWVKLSTQPDTGIVR